MTVSDPHDVEVYGWSSGLLLHFEVRAGRLCSWRQRPCSESAARPRLAATPAAWSEFARRNAELMVRYNFTPDRIIRELAKIAGVNIADYLNAERTGVDLTKATRDQLAAIASVEAGELGPKIKLADKLKALTELAKLARLYPVDRTEISGVVEHQHRIDIEVLDNEKREQLRSVLLALKAKQVEAEARQEAG